MGSGETETESLLTSGDVRNVHGESDDEEDLRSNVGVVADRGVGGSSLFSRDRLSETDTVDGGGGTALLVPDSGVPVPLGLGVGWLLYFARMASLFARRAARVASMGGGVVEISSSNSGSFWGSGRVMRVTAGDWVRDETYTSAGLWWGEILRG